MLIILFQFLSILSYLQVNKVQKNLERIIYKNKIGFTVLGKNVVIVPFDYDLEPKGQRNIARYIAFDTINNANSTGLIVKEKIVDLDNTAYFDSIINNKLYAFLVEKKFSPLNDSDNQPKICDNFFIGGNGFYAVYKNKKYGYINVKGN